jgi:hypothetical protein
MVRFRICLTVLFAGALACQSSAAPVEAYEGMSKGNVELKSATALCFGPHGILFVGDPQAATIYAIDTGDTTPAGGAAIKVEKIDEKVAAMLGTSPKEVLFGDLAVNPASGNAYISVSRGKGPEATVVLLKIMRGGEIKEFPLKDVKFSKTSLANAATGEKSKQDAITQIGFVKGHVIVAGLSNEEFASKLRSIPFPFKEADKGASVEIFHGSHGKFETNSPVRTFVPYDIKGETYLLAAYTCTPLVKIPVSQLKAGEKVKGTTIAELGNMNRPLDMIVYEKDGKDFVLLANNNRGVMKITTENIDKIDGITERIKDKAGLTYQTIDAYKGVEQMAKADKEHALILTRNKETGVMNLETVPLP